MSALETTNGICTICWTFPCRCNAPPFVAPPPNYTDHLDRIASALERIADALERKP